MKTINKSLEFRLYPTDEQQILLNKHFGSIRFVYNWALGERIKEYQENKTNLTYYDQARLLTHTLKVKNEWLYDIASNAQQNALKRVEAAFIGFFKKRSRFPKFKTKKGKNSFTVPGGKIENSKLVITKFQEGIELRQDRDINGRVINCTIKKKPSGKFFVSVLIETQIEEKPKTEKSIGIDLGLKTFFVSSDGVEFSGIRFGKRYQRQLAISQRHLSRKKKDSKRREKQRLKVARIHEKITNSRKNHLQQISSALVNNYDLICLESLDVKSMMQNSKFSRSIADVSWSTFTTYLEYKASWYGKKIVKIDRFYPSSKTCHECGYINQGLQLKDRVWTCKNGHILNRDFNAAKNILREGLNLHRQELAITLTEPK